MGQSGGNNDILGVLQIGFDSIREEIHELEKERDAIFKDVNMKKELARLVKETDELTETKTKLSEEIQFIAAERAGTINASIGKEIGPLTKTKTAILNDIDNLKKTLAVKQSDKNSIETDISVLKAKYDAFKDYANDEKEKLTIFSDGVEKKLTSDTANLEVRETELVKRESKLETNLSYLAGREEKVKSEEIANDELIKGLLKDLEYREKGVENAKAQLESERSKSLDAHNSRNSDLNRRESLLGRNIDEVESREKVVGTAEEILDKREEVVNSREKDLDVNWGVLAKEKGKFKDEKRKFLNK